MEVAELNIDTLGVEESGLTNSHWQRTSLLTLLGDGVADEIGQTRRRRRLRLFPGRTTTKYGPIFTATLRPGPIFRFPRCSSLGDTRYPSLVAPELEKIGSRRRPPSSVNSP